MGKNDVIIWLQAIAEIFVGENDVIIGLRPSAILVSSNMVETIPIMQFRPGIQCAREERGGHAALTCFTLLWAHKSIFAAIYCMYCSATRC